MTQNFVDILQQRAQHQPESTAYIMLSGRGEHEQRISYGELAKRVQSIAAHLQQYCHPGERALLLYPSGLDYICGFFACLYAGVIAVPAYPPTRMGKNLERLQAIRDDAQASILLSTSEIAQNFSDATDASAHANWQSIRWLITDTLDDAACSQWRPPVLPSGQLAFLQYTSGSTGAPKGVMITHQNLISNSQLIHQRFEHSPQSAGVIWLPPYHDMGLIGGILQPVFGGFPTALMSALSFIQRPHLWLQAISRYAATTSGGPDFAYAQCVQNISETQCKGLDLSSWRVAFTGAEPIRHQTLQRFAEKFAPYGFNPNAFYPCYGLAEATLFVSGGKAQTALTTDCIDSDLLQNQQAAAVTAATRNCATLVSCGESQQDQHRIEIVDPVTHTILKSGNIGEIWVSGPSIADGYWQQPELSRTVFHAQLQDAHGETAKSPRFMRTGDYGYMKEQQLYVTGRMKDMLIVRGQNHYPQDIEATVSQVNASLHKGIHTVFSVTNVHASGTTAADRIILICEVDNPGQACSDEFYTGLHQAIMEAVSAAHGLRLDDIVFVKLRSLPKTSSGKIQRFACKQAYLENRLNVKRAVWHDQATPAKPIPQTLDADKATIPLRERMMAAISSLRQIDTVDPDAEFSTLGLDSLELVQLSGQLEDWLGRKIAPTSFFDYPSINKLLAYLAALENPSQPIAARAGSAEKPSAGPEKIAIVGASCRLPGAVDIDSFWQSLLHGSDAISEIPADRWQSEQWYHADAVTKGKMNTRWGGFIEQVDQFDPEFFGISPREALHMDPQQRLLLELSWQAIEDAGIPYRQLAGSRTGVFIGLSNNDYALLNNDVHALDAYSGIGNAHSIAANRLSYFFDLHGPSLTIDTACSSSLTALHIACKSLREGECDTAIVGGINLILRPELHIVFSQARMMSPSGRCKAFDDSADGYVRGEGGVVLVLRRLSSAQQEGHRILANIVGSASNQDGRSNGITAPNGLAQERVIRAALEQARLTPDAVSYVEAHGTGTRLGDPIEYQALVNSYAQDIERDTPLMLGSVKSNIGHLEAAAGVAGILKTVLALQHRILPKHCHFDRLNQHIVAHADVQVCADTMPWQVGSGKRVAGVSSFGFGGSNCHVLLEAAATLPPSAITTLSPTSSSIQHVLTISSPRSETLATLMQQYARFLQQSPDEQIGNICYTSQVGRHHFRHRTAIAAHTKAELIQKLRNNKNSTPVGGDQKNTDIVFIFTGQGSQYPDMGKQLYERYPVFREALEKCNAILRKFWPVSLLAVLYDSEAQSYLAQTQYAQAAIFSLEYALSRLWQSWGIEPKLVIGHSLGEYSAACVAGMYSLADGLKLLVQRGQLMQQSQRRGAMLAVMHPQSDLAVLQSMISARQLALEVAALNSAQMTVFAGDVDAIATFATLLRQQGIHTQALPVEQAFHSAHMEEILPAFFQCASAIAYQAPRIPIISNLTGAPITDAVTAQYWCDHLRQPVQFAKSISHAYQAGYRIFLELGPEAILSGIIKRHATDLVCVASLRKTGNPVDAVATLYAAGIDVDWQAFHAHASLQRVALPHQVFEKKSYWPATSAIAPMPAKSSDACATILSFPDMRMNELSTKTTSQVTDNASVSGAILTDLRTTIAALLHLHVDAVDVNAPFLEMGADSLVLLEAIHAIDDKYHVHLSINQLFEETPTLRELALYLERHACTLRPSELPKQALTLAPAELTPAQPVSQTDHPKADMALAPLPAPHGADPQMMDIVKQQLDVISRQLQLLGQSTATLPSKKPQPQQFSALQLPPHVDTEVANDDPVKPNQAQTTVVRQSTVPAGWGKVSQQRTLSFTAWNRPPESELEQTDQKRQDHWSQFSQHYLARTQTSRELTQRYRAVLADNRASAGFRLSSKEILYPLTGVRSEGAHMWDIDGNEYIDFTMGFGANLFGHAPDFIKQTLHQQIDRGFQIGPQAELAGVVAEKIANLTGQERVAFCNSGSEAVMTAVRLARSVSKRSKIVIFSGSYHGTFDGILARSRIVGDQLHTVPVAGGIPPSFIENEVLVLEYGQAESLDMIRRHGDHLAAVLVEPVQSRFPDFQPREFLTQLRAVTQDASIALIFDEVITGFRASAGGAQAYFGISADLATYGKIVGGGMPIGVVAGKRRYLDAIDGGYWQYGDNSFPRTEQTFFAGTFSKHPLALSASLAVLDKIEREGDTLYRNLNARTATMVQRLNRYFCEQEMAIRVEFFTSLFRFNFSGNLDLLFQQMMSRGIFIWEGRNCFLSTAHSDADIETFIQVVQDSVQALREAGFLPRIAQQDQEAKVLALNPAQQRFAHWAQAGSEADKVCHIGFALQMHGNVNHHWLEQAFNEVISRHETLRASIDLSSARQTIHSARHIRELNRFRIGWHDLSTLQECQRDSALRHWQERENQRPFDLQAPPLLRANLVQLSPDEHVLHLTLHHLICDGMSLALLLDEVSAIYRSQSGASGDALPPALSLSEHDQASVGKNAQFAQAQAYWQQQMTPLPPALFATTLTKSSPLAGRQSVKLARQSVIQLKKIGQKNRCTPFMVLFSAYSLLLAEQTGRDDLAIAVPVIGTPLRKDAHLLGNFVNLLPIRISVSQELNFSEHLQQRIRPTLLRAYGHAEHACLPLMSAQITAASQISATFNLEPALVPSSFGDLQVSLQAVPFSHIEFDLMMNITEDASGLHIDLDHRLEVLDHTQAVQCLQRYVDLLESVIADDEQWQSDEGSVERVG